MAGATLKQRLHRLERDRLGGEVIHVCYGELAGESIRNGYKPDSLELAFTLRQQPDGRWIKENVRVPW